MTVSTRPSIERPPIELSMRFRLSGVVIRISGGCRNIRRRSDWGVSPLLVSTRIAGKSTSRAWKTCSSSSSGVKRFRWISLFSAFSGDTYNTRVAPRSFGLQINWFKDHKNAVRVFPLPVGAVIKTCSPRAITGQALDWISVGLPY